MDRSADRVSFDESRWPIVVVKLPAHGPVLGIHDWYDHVERLLGLADRPIALVHDLREIEILSGSSLHRRTIAERMRRLRDDGLHAKLAADARVFSNDVLANVIAVVDWLAGDRPWPQKNFASMEGAFAWAERCLEVHADLANRTRD